jgi:hypothetical protein
VRPELDLDDPTVRLGVVEIIRREFAKRVTRIDLACACL